MHYNLGNTLERQGRIVDAEEQYRLALAARPAYPEALNNLGALYGRRGETEIAASLFARAVSASPGTAPAGSTSVFRASGRAISPARSSSTAGPRRCSPPRRSPASGWAGYLRGWDGARRR